MFPWEVDPILINKFYSGPYLFAALYKVYRGAYYGRGFQFCGTPLHIPGTFQSSFDNLPLDIKRIILSKVWNQGTNLKTLVVVKGELYLQFELHFLFSQYGRLKSTTQAVFSQGCGAWKGYVIKKNACIFNYGPRERKGKVMIPEFLNSDPCSSTTSSFGLICS